METTNNKCHWDFDTAAPEEIPAPRSPALCQSHVFQMGKSIFHLIPSVTLPSVYRQLFLLLQHRTFTWILTFSRHQGGTQGCYQKAPQAKSFQADSFLYFW